MVTFFLFGLSSQLIAKHFHMNILNLDWFQRWGVATFANIAYVFRKGLPGQKLFDKSQYFLNYSQAITFSISCSFYSYEKTKHATEIYKSKSVIECGNISVNISWEIISFWIYLKNYNAYRKFYLIFTIIIFFNAILLIKHSVDI